MPLFRFYDRDLQKSLKSTVIIKSISELKKHIECNWIALVYAPWKKQCSMDYPLIEALRIETYPYPNLEISEMMDDRTGWYMQAVSIKLNMNQGFQLVGFLSEPLEDNLIVKIVNEQAEDMKLWLGKDIEYVREKLRELHAAIENEAEENDNSR